MDELRRQLTEKDQGMREMETRVEELQQRLDEAVGEIVRVEDSSAEQLDKLNHNLNVELCRTKHELEATKENLEAAKNLLYARSDQLLEDRTKLASLEATAMETKKKQLEYKASLEYRVKRYEGERVLAREEKVELVRKLQRAEEKAAGRQQEATRRGFLEAELKTRLQERVWLEREMETLQKEKDDLARRLETTLSSADPDATKAPSGRRYSREELLSISFSPLSSTIPDLSNAPDQMIPQRPQTPSTSSSSQALMRTPPCRRPLSSRASLGVPGAQNETHCMRIDQLSAEVETLKLEREALSFDKILLRKQVETLRWNVEEDNRLMQELLCELKKLDARKNELEDEMVKRSAAEQTSRGELALATRLVFFASSWSSATQERTSRSRCTTMATSGLQRERRLRHRDTAASPHPSPSPSLPSGHHTTQNLTPPTTPPLSLPLPPCRPSPSHST